MKIPSIDALMSQFNAEVGREKLLAIMKEFKPESSAEDMFKILWNMEKAHTCINVTLVEKKKSEAEAKKLREQGDKHFRENDLDEALYLYTLCLMRAPHPPDCISEDKVKDSPICGESTNILLCSCGNYELLYHCYAKRSSVLYSLKKYELCLRDIMLASVCTELQSELENRKNRCLERLKATNETLRNVVSKLSETISGIPRLVESNPIMPSFSSACQVSYRPEKGRHIIACKPIQSGDVLLVEKAYCVNLYENNHSTHCATCLRECIAPLPCPECTMAVFCSSACCQEGLSGLHRLECPVLNTMYTMDLMPVFGNAFKLLGMASCKEWKGILRKLEERSNKYPPGDRGRNSSGIYSSEDFDSVFSLSPNVEARPCEDLYSKCFIAFVLTKLLQLSGRFFLNDLGLPDHPSEDDYIFAGQLVFSNLMKVSSNGVSIASFQYPGSTFNVVQKEIGTGIYPTIGLVNHSCHQSALPYPYGRYYVLRAARALMPGEEITIGYCRGSYLLPMNERQTTLYDRYQFECSCKACEEEWPLYDQLPSSLYLKCTTCSHPVNESFPICPGCSLNFVEGGAEEREEKLITEWKVNVEEVKSAQMKLQNMMSVIARGQCATIQDLIIIRNVTEVFGKHVSPPARILWDARDTLELYFHLENYLASKQSICLT